jgi:hypothetical protein
MVHPTPRQDDLIEHSAIPTIRSVYKKYETTFVILHPFLKIKPHYNITFETGNWPTKKEIITCTKNITWAEIIQQAALDDLSELDRLLAYLHCERRTADREGWIKLMTLLDKNNIIPAEVDYLPTSLTNPLMTAIKALGYAAVNEFEFTGNLRKQHQIEMILVSEEQDFFSTATVRTPDDKIVFATYFDKRFSYLSGSKDAVNSIIQKAELEGFYCNETTRQEWSDKLQTENVIDWSSPERKKNYT